MKTVKIWVREVLLLLHFPKNAQIAKPGIQDSKLF